MAKLRGILTSRTKDGQIKSEVSRLSQQEIDAHVDTWNTKIYVGLQHDGSAYISVERGGALIFQHRIKKE